MTVEYPKITRAEVDQLLITINEQIINWENNGQDEQVFRQLIINNLKNYQLIQNSSSQNELNEICDKYDWAYPLFQTINDLMQQ